VLTIFLIFLLLFHASYTLTKNSDFWYNGFMTNQEKNDGLALKIFSEMCCSNCSCKSENESQKISEIDNAGREKFWEDIGRPNDGI
jgi:hypothetical protein